MRYRFSESHPALVTYTYELDSDDELSALLQYSDGKGELVDTKIEVLEEGVRYGVPSSVGPIMVVSTDHVLEDDSPEGYGVHISVGA